MAFRKRAILITGLDANVALPAKLALLIGSSWQKQELTACLYA